MHIEFVNYLPFTKITGGTLYQKELTYHLRARGHQVNVTLVDDYSTPDSLTATKPDVILWDGISILGWYHRWGCLPHHYPQALIVHAPFSTQHNTKEPWFSYTPEQLYEVEKLLYAQIDHIMVPSRRIKQVLIDEYAVDGDKVSVQSPTAFLPISPHMPRNLSRDEWTFVSIGTISPRKNQLSLVQALSRFTNLNWKLHLIGGLDIHSMYAKRINSFIDKQNINNRIWMGPRATDEVLKIISQTHMHLFASFDEGFGMAIYETIHAGVPTCYIEGNCGLPMPFRSTILVDPTNDADAWEQVIKRFLSCPDYYEAVAARYKGAPPGWDALALSVEQRFCGLLTNKARYQVVLKPHIDMVAV